MRWTSKAQFYAAASEAMRRILIEYARSKGRLKRGGSSKRLPVDVVDLAAHEDAGSIMSVDAAISRLEAQDERMGKIVRLRFYAGLSARDTALSLDIGERTVQREWVMARAWLIRDLEGR